MSLAFPTTNGMKIVRPEDYQLLIKLKSLIFISALIFLIASLSGFLSSFAFPQLPEKILENFDEVVGKILELNNFELFLFIFINNGLKIIAAVFLGVFFGLVPLIFLLTNGFVVGLVAYSSTQSLGLVTFWLAILPHGIFEIPALILGTGAGFHLGDILYKKIFLREKMELVKYLVKILKFSLRVILPLIFIAAFIEVFITAFIIQ